MATYKVRAEITGDFVRVESFKTEIEARAYEYQLFTDGIWDSIEVIEVREEQRYV